MFSLDGFVGLVAPHNCLICGMEGSLICGWCRDEALSPLPPRCYRCHRLADDYAVCETCRRSTKLRHVWIRANYDKLPRMLVNRLKFERAQAAAETIAELMAETLPVMPKDLIVCHVPTATNRRRQRGYDQAELIARSLAKLRGLQHVSLLARLGQSRQVGAKRAQRQVQLAKAFRPINPARVKGAPLLLVDDIVTTGATLESAAEALQKAGANKVYAAAFAQKL